MNEVSQFNICTDSNQEPECELLYYTALSDILDISSDSEDRCLLKTHIEVKNMNNSLLSNDSFAQDNCTDDSDRNPVANSDLSLTDTFARMIVSYENNNLNITPMPGSDSHDDVLEVPCDVPLQEPCPKCNVEGANSDCLDSFFKQVQLSTSTNSSEANCSQLDETAEVFDKMPSPAPDVQNIGNNIKNIHEADDSTCQNIETLAGNSSDELSSSWPDESKSNDISTHYSPLVTNNEDSITTSETELPSETGDVTPSYKSSKDDCLFKVPATPTQVVVAVPKAVLSISASISDAKKDCLPFCEAYELSAFKQSPESQPVNPLSAENQFEPTIVTKDFLGDLSSNLPVSDVSSGLPEPRVFTDIRKELTLENVCVEDNPSKAPNPPKDEFTDAVQFFKDPSCFQYLESIQTSMSTESIPRSSLYIEFDPLYSRRVSMSQMKSSPVSIISEAESDHKISTPFKKHQVDASARETIGVLISFDSPKPSSKVARSQADDLHPKTPAIKQYTEEELQQILKNHELTMQDMHLRKHSELEQEMARAEENNQDTIKKLISLTLVQKAVLELSLVVKTIALQKENLEKKASKLEEQNEKLKDDVKTAVEAHQSVSNTFSNLHKRHEQCKSMLKIYKENEIYLKNKISDLESKYNTLQEHSHALERANLEAITAKKSSEGQVTVLQAQLKKAELKISSLESDLSQVKIENSKLGGICDDLMAKVSGA